MTPNEHFESKTADFAFGFWPNFETKAGLHHKKRFVCSKCTAYNTQHDLWVNLTA